jgi:glycosyltransferase involved in cell wall biosynthesis
MTPTGAPLVSVVIPSYNQARFLGEAIESALGQSHPSTEVVVADDGSTDESVAIAERYPVRLVRHANMGVSPTRNAGLAASRGDLVVFLDGDDRLMPDALAIGVRELAAEPTAAFAAGRYRHIDLAGAPGRVYTWGNATGSVHEQLLKWNIIGMLATVIFRREALPEVAFEPTLRSAEDWDLYLRIVRDHPVRLHDAIVAEYRRYPHSKSGNPARMLGATMAVLDRQREWVRAHPAFATALREGVRQHCEWYGTKAVDDVLHCLREPALRATAGPKVAMLARHYPLGAMRHLAGRVRDKLSPGARNGG